MKEKIMRALQIPFRSYPRYTLEVMAENLIEQGVIIPPFRVGDKVWCITNKYGHVLVKETTVIEVYYRHKEMIPCIVTMQGRGVCGEKVFATKEEAEAKLKEIEERKIEICGDI